MRSVTLFSAVLSSGLAATIWAQPDLPFFGLPSNSYETYPSNAQPIGRLRDGLDPAIRYIAEKTQVPPSQIKITHEFTSAGARFVYTQRVIDSLPVGNSIAHTVIKDNSVLAFSSSFSTAPLDAASGTLNNASPEAAIAEAIKTYGAPRNDYPVRRGAADQNGLVVPTWNFELQASDKWYDIHARVNDSQIISVSDYVKRFSYTAANFREITPRVANGSGIYTPSENDQAVNWHKDATTTYDDTRGNNAQTYTTINKRKVFVKSNDNGNFNYPYDFKAEANTVDNKKAATVSLFYLVNEMHDLTALYGFDEASGNFQDKNFSGQGKGGDAVEVSSQDPSGVNNANFATPPDGRKPRMNMYLFKTGKKGELTTDGGYEPDIPIHEFTHGISSRLTGGAGSAPYCLNYGESGGLGEGWSDALGLMITSKPNTTGDVPVAVGSWVLYIPTIRGKLYSTDMKVNDYTLASSNQFNEVHDIGEIWATIWNELYWAMRDQNGFSDNIWDASQDKGNIHALHLFIMSLKTQPCQPDFKTARDAIITAEEILYKGKYKCSLWKALAKRGLGYTLKAKASSRAKWVDSNDVPDECKA